MSRFDCLRRGALRFFGAILVAFSLCFFSLSFGQTSVSTGSIAGTVTDPTGAVLEGAQVTITNLGTNQVLTSSTSPAGLYNSGPIVPGNYRVRVEAKGFRSAEITLMVYAGAATPGNVRLDFEGGAIALNTRQATVQGAVTPRHIENLPVNGRNFLDLAQLEAGVQIEDGSGLDPTKNGFSSISIGRRSGRSTRIEVDGIDISDESVGTTTQNLPAAAIQEFQVGQSSLDLSSSLTSSGVVNVTTRSGSNKLHGQGNYFFRDQSVGFANFPGGLAVPYQRNQPGGNIGGPILKDKLFFFADVEHTKQDFQNAVVLPGPFDALSGSYSAPFRDSEYLGRLDWMIRPAVHAFGRFTYNDNSDLRPSSDLSPFFNRDNTRGLAGGVDFNTGSYTHSIRAGYGKFWNGITPPAASSFYNPLPRVNILIGSLATGSNSLAPQVTIQSNKQVKYDGSRPWKNHIFRYGVGYNRIAVGGFAAFGAEAPTVTGNIADTAAAARGPFPGGISNPLNYIVEPSAASTAVTVYNGQGFFSEKPSFGYPAGGQFDTRIEFYAGDTWKVRSNLTVSYGVHYVRDTGRTDSDLAPIPCSATTLISCAGNLLDQFGYPGLGNRIRQPNKNFGPQVGIAWDPTSNGKTVVRAGAGIYYENNLFNNILFDRTVRLQNPLFFGRTNLCPNGGILFPNGTTVTSVDGLDIATQICGQPIGTVGNALADLQQQLQAAVAAAGPGNDAFFVGNALQTFGSLLAPNYLSPRSLQMNIGFQRQIRPGTVLSVDYVRNVGTHFLLGIDTNQVGDAQHLDPVAAARAISATNSQFGCGTGSDTASVNCAITAGATIKNYASNGLDSAAAFCGGFPCSRVNLPNAAFGGINPSVGQNIMFFPVGRSLYSALQISLKSDMDHPFRRLNHLSYQVSYARSRFESDVPVGGSGIQGDQDFLAVARDYRNPTGFFGPAGQDRKHQLSFGPIFDFAKGFQLSAIGHFDSPLPLTMFLPRQGAGDIFISDVTGDGTTGDIVPGSNVGFFGRGIKPGGLNGFITGYLSKFGAQFTPAGVALLTTNNLNTGAPLFTQQQLGSLGGVTPGACRAGLVGTLFNGLPCINTAPPGNVGLGWLKSVDLRLAWTYKIKERFTIQPAVTFYNGFNFANFDGPANLPSGVLQGAAGSEINNLTAFSPCNNCSAKQSTRIGPGSGTFSLGAPRETEFALKISF